LNEKTIIAADKMTIIKEEPGVDEVV